MKQKESEMKEEADRRLDGLEGLEIELSKIRCGMIFKFIHACVCIANNQANFVHMYMYIIKFIMCMRASMDFILPHMHSFF